MRECEGRGTDGKDEKGALFFLKGVRVLEGVCSHVSENGQVQVVSEEIKDVKAFQGCNGGKGCKGIEGCIVVHLSENGQVEVSYPCFGGAHG